MKKLLLLPVLLAFVGCASLMGTKTESNLPTQERTLELNGNKNELYVKANTWMVENFKSAKSVIQFSDKESGTVMGRYYLADISATGNQNDNYVSSSAYAVIKLLVKDNAAKIEIAPEKVTYMKGNMYNLYDEQKAKESIDGLLVSFEDYMKQDSSDW